MAHQAIHRYKSASEQSPLSERKFMKVSLVLLLSALVSNVSVAGPYVSEGPGPVGEIISCVNPANRSIFEIRHTAIVTFKQGFYAQGDYDVSMGCKQSYEGWDCSEISRNGNVHLLQAKVATNNQGILIADLFRYNIAGMPVQEDSLVCKVVGEL